MADLDAVADAAVDAADNKTSDLPFRLAKLGEALLRAGNNIRAKLVLNKAADSGKMVSLTRGIIVEKLAQLGDVAEAQSLANIDASAEVRAMLLGKLGVGLALAGKVEPAQHAAKAVKSIGDADASAAVAGAVQTSLAQIATALGDAGKPAEALGLIDDLPDDRLKLRALASVANRLCKAGSERLNRESFASDIVKRAADAARVAVRSTVEPYLRDTRAQFAVEAIAWCAGAETANAFAAELVPSDAAYLIRSTVADKFTDAREFELARAIAPSPDPTNAGQLFGSARRLMKQGDQAAAVRDALAASRLATAVLRDPAAQQLHEHSELLGKISGLLIELGESDAAIAAVQPVGIYDRQQYLLSNMRTMVQRRDAAAIVRSLPDTIAAMQVPNPARGKALLLYNLTETLALGGYLDEANKSYRVLQELSDSPPGKPSDWLHVSQLAALKAVMGDIPGALLAADKAGPIVTKPTGLDAAVMLMGLGATKSGGSGQKPTEAEALAEMRSLVALLPPLTTGPKATALSAIAVELAAQGNIADALQVAAELDVEPRDVLRATYEGTLVRIAMAQEKTGDPRGSFATALRITDLQRRWGVLLKLAARPLTP